jgi:uncharacterized damage-inducible protein DinB
MYGHYRMFADYNRWATTVLYAAVAELSDREYRETAGTFFGSLHGMLSHLPVTDRMWMQRLTPQGRRPHRRVGRRACEQTLAVTRRSRREANRPRPRQSPVVFTANPARKSYSCDPSFMLH